MDYDLLTGLMSNDSTARQSHNMLPDLPNSELKSVQMQESLDSTQTGQGDGPPMQDALPNRNTAGAVITQIENIFESITDCLLDDKNEFTICLKTRPRRNAQEDEANNGKKRLMSGVRKVTFPNRNPKEAWKFSRCSLRRRLFRLTLCSDTSSDSGIVA
jgi:meiotic recombination protein SPO11